MSHDTQAIVIACLVEQGWAQLREECATREFETAVGTKEAVAYCRPSSREPLIILSGEYQSEGRNVLATCSELIPADADPASVRAAALRFCAEANAKVDGSYARHLRLIGAA